MATLSVKNLENSATGSIELDDEVFGERRNDHVVFEEIRRFRASQRAGTHQTKTRGDVSGGGKKPWRQKGTGRARAGSIRSPLWRGGGTVHGPQPRDYSYTIPRKVKKQAMRVALSEKLRDEQLMVVDAFNLSEAKTKLVERALKSLGVGRSALIVDDAANAMLRRAARNHAQVKVVSPSAANVYDVLYHEHLIVTRACVDKLTEIFKPAAAPRAQRPPGRKQLPVKP